MESTNKFSAAEKLGRQMWQHYTNAQSSLINGVKFSKNQYAAYDTVYNQNEIPMVGEIKVRNCPTIKYNSMFILEKIKYDGLKETISTQKAKELGTQITYINFFQDGVMAIWNLTDIEPKFELRPMPRTTMGNKEEVDTLVTYLDINDAELFYFASNTEMFETFYAKEIAERQSKKYQDDKEAIWLNNELDRILEETKEQREEETEDLPW